MSIRFRPPGQKLWGLAPALAAALAVLGLAAACGGDEGEEDTGEEEVSVSGVFSVQHGDPPDGSSSPAVIEYLLEGDDGREWWLVFDDDVYEPAGGVRQFDREQVEVRGVLTGDEGEILVTAIALGGDENGPAAATPGTGQDDPPGEETVVTGFFSFLYGDPPPDSDKEAVIRYMLEDVEGGEWQLVFDEDVYMPAGGLRQFDRERVEVAGTVMDEGSILVTSIEIVQ